MPALKYYNKMTKQWLKLNNGDSSLVVDSILSDESINPVQNKVIKTALDSKSSTDHTHTVDTALSDTSENPLQNKVIKTALDNKSDIGHTHTADDIIINSSTVDSTKQFKITVDDTGAIVATEIIA